MTKEGYFLSYAEETLFECTKVKESTTSETEIECHTINCDVDNIINNTNEDQNEMYLCMSMTDSQENKWISQDCESGNYVKDENNYYQCEGEMDSIFEENIQKPNSNHTITISSIFTTTTDISTLNSMTTTVEDDTITSTIAITEENIMTTTTTFSKITNTIETSSKSHDQIEPTSTKNTKRTKKTKNSSTTPSKITNTNKTSTKSNEGSKPTNTGTSDSTISDTETDTETDDDTEIPIIPEKTTEEVVTESVLTVAVVAPVAKVVLMMKSGVTKGAKAAINTIKSTGNIISKTINDNIT
eukprot:jgi/Orpsp1_1/1191510/evm.model.d7180000086475.1